MKVLILHPRLDLTFKKGTVTSNKNPNLPPIRKYWKQFLNNLIQYHKDRGDIVDVIELPLWQFNTIQVLERKPNIVYVPHKDIHRFNCYPVKALFYMQMVFPWVFELDTQGPFSYSTNYPQPIYKNVEIDYELIKNLKDRALSGKSKFDQPNISIKDEGYVFFIGQMERDESIRLHSKVGVHEALEKTIVYCKENDLPLIVKPHPFESKAPAENLVRKYNYGKIVNANINYLLQKCKAAVTVNSGAGMEALLFDKPVLYFGEAEYAPVAHKIEDSFPSLQVLNDFINLYPLFITSYFKDRIDSNDISEYSKLEKFF